MKNLNNTITKCLLLIPVLFSLFMCRPFPKKGTESFKIIDHLDSPHIIASPYQDLIQKFQSVEEILTGKWIYIPEFSNQNRSIWGATTGFNILGDPGSYNTDEVRLMKNGHEVSYLTQVDRNEDTWRWIESDEILDLRSDPGFDRKHQGVVLNAGSSFQFEKILPDGEVLLELYIVNKNWEHYQPKLTVSINGVDIEDIFISRKKWFRIRYNSRLGFHRIEIKFPDQAPNSTGQFAVIGQIRLEGPADIVLLSTAPSANRQAPEGKIQFHYHRNDMLSPEHDPTGIDENLYLYNFRKKFPIHDFSITANPLQIKKKLEVGEYTLNALIAPARSEYSIPVRISPDAVLEFGYGYFNDSRTSSAEKFLKLQILLEIAGKEELLFAEEFTLEMLEEIKRERIDLSSFGHKKANLTFVSERIPSNQGHEMIGMPFWVNPLIYSARETGKLNVVLISLDTLRSDFLGCYGHKDNISPAIDATAQDSAIFLNTYSTTSWTLPAHVSLLTSLDCLQHQIYYPLEKFKSDIPTLADILRMNGFTTTAFTGGAYLSSSYGFAKGFDSYQEIKLRGNKALRFDEAERLADLSCAWIKQNHDKEFFLFLHTYQPHDPYANLSPAGKMFLDKNAKWDQIRMETLFEEGERYETSFSDEEKGNIIGLYQGEIKYTDEVLIQPVIQTLKNLNIYDNTMVIITSDHGEEFYDHEAWLHDHSLYEEGIKIPLIIKFPDSQFKGKRLKNIVRITDIMPTILDQLKIKTIHYTFDGRSLLSILTGKETSHRTFLSDLALRQFQTPPSIITTNFDNLKLIINKKVVSPYINKKSQDFNDLKIELYDVENDPDETINLAKQTKYRSLCLRLTRETLKKYENFSLDRSEKDKVVLDSSLEERLRALGYIK